MSDVKKMKEELIAMIQGLDETKIDSHVFSRAVSHFKKYCPPASRNRDVHYTDTHNQTPNHSDSYDKDAHDKGWSENWSDSDPNAGHDNDHKDYQDTDSGYTQSWNDSANR